MAARKTPQGSADTRAAVDAFVAALAHPHVDAVQRLREIVRAVDPSIAEGVKWNAPSFRTHEYFATTHLRAKRGIGLVLHLGAKVRDPADMAIDDPEHLLGWLGPDRAMLTFADRAELEARAPAVQALLRQWIAYV